MKYFKKTFIQCSLLAVLFLFLESNAQELPPIQLYSPQDYQADDQNWSISQDENEIIYIANNKGLLEFNGARWTLNKSPNQSIVRSVAVIDSLVYTGSYMDFGFWKRDTYGNLNYISLVNKLEEELAEDEEFWNIISYNKFVLFQSLDKIYIYNTVDETFKIIESKSGIHKAFKIENSIYFQDVEAGVFKIENGKPMLFTADAAIKDKLLINIFKNDEELLFQTKEDGFYRFKNNNFEKWQIPSNDKLSQISAYNSIRLKDGSFIIGTISRGLLQLDASGTSILQINKGNGLSNNTVLSAFQDISGNLWLGLDNGIAMLNLNSPYKMFRDTQGVLGTVYTSEKIEDDLYLGTNQGLFSKTNTNNKQFLLIPNTKGQVWSLKEIDGTLFCSHDKGTLIVDDNKVVSVVNNVGTWLVKPALNRSNIFLTGNYDGLNVLQKAKDGTVYYKNKIKGFNISSRYFEFINPTQILVSHEYKGVFLLTLDDALTKVNSFKKLNIEKGIGSSLVKFNDDVYYAYEKGIFRFNKSLNQFEETKLFSNYFKKSNYVSGKFVFDESNSRVWNFFKNQLTFFESGKLTEEPVFKVIDLPSAVRNSKPGFENILYLSTNEYLLGATNGYVIINTSKNFEKEYFISIDKILFSQKLQNYNQIDLSKDLKFENKQNNFRFNYSISNFSKLSPTLYQYRLKGIYDSWSDWSSVTEAHFENLPHGNYTFEVRARVGNQLSLNTASYSFEIDKPWYLQPLAIISYVFLFLILATTIQYFNRLYFKNQQKRIVKAKEKELEINELESQKQLMAFKNETLQKDIENKNRELGLSTMTLIRKNEFLNSLKKELATVEDKNDLNKITKIIDKNINNNEDWKFFEEAFNNADKDFLKKIKKKHPSLTPNDLKLCAYLRLNLSSKEIAPLLNISHRSVEVKRYRLRKKMELPHEASLTNYIIEI
ncbi:triple tyrosine motif-containing protein [Winogradskyella litorisediminis]|uniref:Triple tyrosine motif-containing protein n=1 Tax=Winogradskyella litorisediminis TaxID=1156618 RepID=A0ABW3N6I5_9FLAO